ncbi:MAG: ABC transporter permease [Candidatus Aminicenantes bacterium]|nr:ABC transporter permease [Candidatus Aminicenantes bacterium]
MFRNFVKIAVRNLVQRKMYSLVNIFGLAVGVACSLLILAYVGYEFSFDRYHKNADRIYRVASKRTSMGTENAFATVPAPTGPTMVADYPEVVEAVRFSPTVRRAFSTGDRVFFQDGVFYADQSVFKVFSFELVKGDPASALEAPFTMVLSEETARKYFGDEDPLGKTVKWDNRFDYRVTGVVKDPPPNSHFAFKVLASFSTFLKYDPRIGEWGGGAFATYIELEENADPKAFERKLDGFSTKYFSPLARDTGVEFALFLQPLKTIHLRSRLQGELGANGDVGVVAALAAVAVVILLVACVNFMNLATARSANRAREVGMRKILGAGRRALILQFLGESYVYSLIAFLVAVSAARLLLPYFSGLAGRNIPAGLLGTPTALGGLAAVFFFVGLAAGSYPALFLSSFKPISVLRGHLSRGSRGPRFRSALVVFQFAASTVLIISTLVILSQMKYMRTKALGFDKKGLLVLTVQNEEVRRGLEAFKTEVLRIPGVTSAGGSSMVPGEMYLFNLSTFPEGHPRNQALRMDEFLVDYGFVGTLGIEVVKGRAFSKESTADQTEGVMINETAARKLQWDDPIGKTIELRAPFSNDAVNKKVIGVFRDIHQRSLYAVVEPTVVEYVGTEGPIENRVRRLSLRLETDDILRVTARVEAKWKEMFPDYPYDSFFLGEFYDGRHTAEARLGAIFKAFSLVAVLIGCVGLVGLASYASEQRTKEIGIRKVLGSSSGSIVVLLGREFILLIGVANALAWPIAYFVARHWLRDFPYAVEVRVGAFLLTAVLTLVIASLSVGTRSIMAARANPVESLRHE